MANTFIAIATTTVGSGGASNIDFTSIPNTYTDLLILASIRSDRNERNDALSVQFNNSGGTAYQSILFFSDSSAVSTQKETNKSSVTYASTVSAATATAASFGNAMIYIPNYANSSNKSITTDTVSANNRAVEAGDQVIYLAGGLWSNTSAITSVKIAPMFGSNFVQYSTATLYGIKSS